MSVPSLLDPDASAAPAAAPAAGPPRRSVPRRRFLFAVPPLTGHVEPAVPVASELARRGHRVAWTGRRAFLEPLLRRRSQIFGAEDAALTARLEAARREWPDLSGPAALRHLWEEFAVPLGYAMMPGVEAAVKRFRPAVIVSDQQVLAAPVVARLRGVPWATSATASAALPGPPAETGRSGETHMAAAEERVREVIGDFQRDHGIEDVIDLRLSDHLVLAFADCALIGDTSFFPDHFAFVGAAGGAAHGADRLEKLA